MTDNSLSKIPYWDGKSESFGVYVSKIEAYAEFMGVGDALDPVLMANCPTKSEFAALDVTDPGNTSLVELYKANKKLCAIIALGQGKSHGIALLGKTKSEDYPNGLAYEFIEKAKKANKPSDASAMIELEVELEKLQLKGARDFYNDVVGVLDKYEVTKTDHELCMLMARKNHDTSYARLILDELKSRSPDFDGLCNSVSEIQRLTKSGSRGRANDKEVHLSSVEGDGTFKGKCRNCGKVCGFKAKECKKRKGELHGGRVNGDSEGNTSSSKTCNFCGLKGHKEAGCFKKFPEKAPAWYKEKNSKAEAASSSVEVSLASIDPEQLGIDVLNVQANGDDALAILRQENVWICDTGASTHVTWCNKGARNVRDTMVYSLGHTGSAAESTALIDIPGVFVNKHGNLGLQAVLRDCSFSAKHNFNLLSMSKLLHKQGWKIVRGDESLIRIENGKGGTIDFDIVVPTEKGAIYACKFTRTLELATASADTPVRLNINMAHCLLGHRNEDSVRKTARELGWVLSRGTLKPCEHCARSKAKQKNVRKESVAPKADVPGHRLYLDLSKVTVKSETSENVSINRDNWKVLVCEATGKKWSDFTVTRSESVERSCEHFHKLKTRGIPVRYVRLDPAGENHKLAKRAGSSDWAVLQPIDFEFTSRDTPQHNSLAELAFPYLAGKARAMMGGAMVPDDLKSKVALEAISCATQLDGLVVVEVKGKIATRDMHMCGANPAWSRKLRVWGEAGVVAVGKDSKTGDKGATMMFVGYAERESDSVRMWDMRTSRVVVSRDIMWLKRMFF